MIMHKRFLAFCWLFTVVVVGIVVYEMVAVPRPLGF